MFNANKAALFVALTAFVVSTGRGGDTFSVLSVGSQTFTNAKVISQSTTDVFIRHSGGVANFKLRNLDADLQKQLGYDGSKPESTEKIADTNFLGMAHIPSIPGKSFLSTNASARPEGTCQKIFAIGDTGSLSLYVPGYWKFSVIQSPDSRSATTIRFQRQLDDDFVFVVTTIPKDGPLNRMGIHQLLEMTGNRALLTSVENKLVLQELTGDQSKGSFFSLTDKKLVDQPSLKPGTYVYQTQGAVNVGDLELSFVILYNYQNSADFNYALELLETAHFSQN